jgi:L-alanine-DL-glutamate epimerase-like enolase superfamily enzyme
MSSVSRSRSPAPRARIEGSEVTAITVPTAEPESDGTFEWDSTTAVVVELHSAGASGLGLSYTAAAAADLIRQLLVPALRGRDPMDIPAAAGAMARAVRNVGARGVAASAIAAVEIALWDLKARLLGVALVDLFGAARDGVPIYGSGGFTSLSDDQLAAQLKGWVDRGVRRVKMKVGREPARDPDRVARARAAIGPDVELMVDANGAYRREQALAMAQAFSRSGVVYFEEPVSSDDLEGLRLVRERAPAGMAIAAGEYGWELGHFQRLLAGGAVDILQADVTRCQGLGGFLAADVLCQAHRVPLSAHCAPALHVHAAAAARTLIHIESFYDHERIERLVLDGLPREEDGCLWPDRSRPGHGLSLRRSALARFAAR